MIVCEVKWVPEPDDEPIDAVSFYHEYYYSLNVEAYDGTLMFGPVDHYRETMERFELWKEITAALGGGVMTMYRLWDKYVPDDEDFEPDVECVWEIYDDSSEEEMYALDEDE